MLTTDRSQQLNELLGVSIAGFDIPDHIYETAVSRYGHLGAALSDYWQTSPDDGIVYPQGSFRLGTVVQPINPGDDYDIDLVCRRDLRQEGTSQADLKSDVGAGLAVYVASSPDGRPVRVEGNRCWTLNYPFEPFHIDILPAIPSLKGSKNAILLTDKTLQRWQPSNPIDYATWFHRRMREEFIQLREALTKAMVINPVPEWKVKTTLQRTVQALKRHRDQYFVQTPEARPASIIITTLAAQAYTNGGDLYQVLTDVTSKMAGLVDKRRDGYWVPNPVQPDENFADRWHTHPGSDQRFFEWLQQAKSDFAGFGHELGVDHILAKLSKSFGEGVAKSTGQAFGSSIVQGRNAGLLSVAAGTGMLDLTGRRHVPQHQFHGDPPYRVER